RPLSRPRPPPSLHPFPTRRSSDLFFSSGMLADFFGRLSGEPVAVMEVECRSRNDERCRFLSASPDTLNVVYEQMKEGRGYEEARSEEHTSELQSRFDLVCRLLLEK